MSTGPLADVSRETLDRLHLYRDLLLKWSPKINLVAPATFEAAWDRHFLDSAQVAALAPAGSCSWADLGSGGGFPGLVVAILRQDIEMTLIESDQRKAAFLRTVARETECRVTIRAERAESVPPLGTDVVSARALAPLTKLIPLAKQHLSPDGFAVFPKGAHWRSERDAALETWTFRCENITSKTDPDAVILKLSEIRRV